MVRLAIIAKRLSISVTIPFKVRRQPLNWRAAASEIGARMAFFKSFGRADGPTCDRYDPHKLSSPQVFLLSMLIFLAIVAFIAAILYRQISIGLRHQSRPQRPDRRRAGRRHPAGLHAGRPAVSRSALGQFLPRRLRRHRTGAAGADEGAARPLVDDGAVDQLDAHHARFHRHPPRRKPRHLALSRRPAGLPRPARHLLGPARHDRLDRRHHPVARSRLGRRRRRARMR